MSCNVLHGKDFTDKNSIFYYGTQFSTSLRPLGCPKEVQLKGGQHRKLTSTGPHIKWVKEGHKEAQGPLYNLNCVNRRPGDHLAKLGNRYPMLKSTLSNHIS